MLKILYKIWLEFLKIKVRKLIYPDDCDNPNCYSHFTLKLKWTKQILTFFKNSEKHRSMDLGLQHLLLLLLLLLNPQKAPEIVSKKCKNHHSKTANIQFLKIIFMSSLTLL